MKRLVVCLDGTWNTPDEGENPTNVVKLMRALCTHSTKDGQNIPQIVFYDKGVGTGGPIDRVRGGALGRGLDENILDGYRFIAHNYASGDEIYIFGFSRGAFTARSLAGFIGWVGLLENREMHRLRQSKSHPQPGAWEIYRERDKTGRETISRFSRTGVRIKCIGVWDTVGALGIPTKLGATLANQKYAFHDTNLGAHIDHAFHAVAIDEKRGPFEPTLWETPVPDGVKTVEQVWFAGVHSNVGGSYRDAGLSDIALDWVIKRVGKTTELEFDEAGIENRITPNVMGTLYDSLGWYAYSRALPFHRVIGGCKVDQSGLSNLLRRTHQPSQGQSYVNEMIHRTALERFGKKAPVENGEELYQPENLAKAKDRLPIVEHDGSITQPE